MGGVGCNLTSKYSPESRIGSESHHKLLPSELTKTKTCSSAVFNTTTNPAILPASRVPHFFSKASLHDHEQSWQTEYIAPWMLAVWRYIPQRQQLSERLCERAVIQQSEIKREIKMNDDLELDSFSIDQSITFITLSASNFTSQQPCPIMVEL